MYWNPPNITTIIFSLFILNVSLLPRNSRRYFCNKYLNQHCRCKKNPKSKVKGWCLHSAIGTAQCYERRNDALPLLRCGERARSGEGRKLIKYIKVKWLGGIAFTKVRHKKNPPRRRGGLGKKFWINEPAFLE